MWFSDQFYLFYQVFPNIVFHLKHLAQNISVKLTPDCLLKIFLNPWHLWLLNFHHSNNNLANLVKLLSNNFQSAWYSDFPRLVFCTPFVSACDKYQLLSSHFRTINDVLCISFKDEYSFPLQFASKILISESEVNSVDQHLLSKFWRLFISHFGWYGSLSNHAYK